MKWTLVRSKAKDQEVDVGDEVTGMNGIVYIIQKLEPPAREGSTGKVIVAAKGGGMSRTLFAPVVDCTYVERE